MGMGICRQSLMAAAGAMLLAVGGLPAAAGTIADSANEAEGLLQQGKPSDALSAFDKATDAFWSASPLEFRVATFASSVKGFGQYEPRGDVPYHAGDTATVYLEPVGYGFTADGPSFTVAFTPAVEIRTAGGILLAKADNLGQLAWHGRAHSHEVQAAVSLTLPTLKPGDYRLKLTLTDAATAKQASVTLPLAIAK